MNKSKFKKKINKIPLIYDQNRRGITNRYGKNKGNSGIKRAKEKRKGTRFFWIGKLLQGFD